MVSSPRAKPVGDPAGGREEHGLGDEVGRQDQAQVHGTGVELPSQGRQGRGQGAGIDELDEQRASARQYGDARRGCGGAGFGGFGGGSGRGRILDMGWSGHTPMCVRFARRSILWDHSGGLISDEGDFSDSGAGGLSDVGQRAPCLGVGADRVGTT